jgi:hypothetical protein
MMRKYALKRIQTQEVCMSYAYLTAQNFCPTAKKLT